VGTLDTAAFVSPISNYYMTDPISRVSATMAACTQTYQASRGGRTGTHG
jgi:NADH-quinone oxidoreductase subunit G